MISEAVERRMLDILGHPTHSPYGNPIPGLAELGDQDTTEPLPQMVALAKAPAQTRNVTVRRIAEPIQSNTALLAQLRHRTGFRPNAKVPFSRAGSRIRIGVGPEPVELDQTAASHIFVTIP